MATCQAVADVLDETIKALVLLDLETLQILQERAKALAESNLVIDSIGINSVLARKQMLELVLHGSASNLNALNRLYGKDPGGPWEL